MSVYIKLSTSLLTTKVSKGKKNTIVAILKGTKSKASGYNKINSLFNVVQKASLKHFNTFIITY